MADNISVKLKLDGEQEFKRGVKSASTELKNMNSQLKTLEAEAKSQGKSVKDVTDYQQKYEKALTASKNQVEAYTKALEHARQDYDKINTALAEHNKKLDEEKAKLEAMTKAGTASEEELKAQKQAVNDLQKAVDTGNRNLQTAADRINEWEKGLSDANRAQIELKNSTEGSATAQENLNTAVGKIESWTKLGEIVGNVGGKIKDFGDKALSAAESYETGLAKIRSIAGSGFDLGRAGEELLNLSTETGVAVDDLTEATYQALSASVDAADATQFVAQATKLARGGFTSTTDAVDVLTTAINAYNLSAEDAAKISDYLVTTQNRGKTTVGQLAQNLGQVIPTASAFGVELDNLSAAYITMTRNGINTANATTYIRAMMNELGDEGSKVSKVLKDRTGKSFAQLNKAGYSLGDVMAELQKEVKGDTTAFVNLWGNMRAGQGALSIANSGVERFNEDLAALNESAGATDEAFETMSETSEQTAARLEASLQKALISVGDTMVPFENAMRESGIQILNWFADAVKALPEPIQNVIGGIMSIGSMAGQVAPQVMSLVTQIASLKAASALVGGNLFPGLGTLAGLAGPFALAAGFAVASVAAWTAAAEVLRDLIREEYELAEAARASKTEYKDVNEELERLKNGEYDYMTAAEKAALANDLLRRSQTNQTKATETQSKALKRSSELWRDNGEAIQNGYGIGTEILTEYTARNEELWITMQTTEEVIDDTADSLDELAVVASRYNVEAAELTGSAALARDEFLKIAETMDQSSEAYRENMAAVEELTNKHVEAVGRIQGNIDSLKEQLSTLTAEYEASKEKFKTTFDSIFSIWDAAPQVQKVSMDQIIGNLATQAQYFDKYYADMRKAIENGYSEDFVKSLNDGSEKAAAIYAAMAEDTDKAYVEMLNSQFDATEKSKRDLAEYSAEIETNYSERHKALQADLRETIKEMNQEKQAYYNTVQTINGAIRAIDEQGGRLIAKYSRLAQDATNAYKQTLQIQSPSKVFEELGAYTVQGAIVGTDEMANELKHAYASLATMPVSGYAQGLEVTMPDMSKINTSNQVVNEVHVYIGDRELTAEMASGVIREITDLQRQAYAGGY